MFIAFRKTGQLILNPVVSLILAINNYFCPHGIVEMRSMEHVRTGHPGCLRIICIAYLYPTTSIHASHAD